jgi:hypothetical protein
MSPRGCGIFFLTLMTNQNTDRRQIIGLYARRPGIVLVADFVPQYGRNLARKTCTRQLWG